MITSGSPNSTGWPSSTRICVTVPARGDGIWFIVVGCPTEKGLAFFHERQAKAAQQREQAAEHVGKLQEPLLSEIKELLARNRRVEAINRYQSAAGVDLTTAVQVINALGKPSQ